MADYFQEMSWTPLGEGEAPNAYLHLARLLQDLGMWEELGTNKKLPPPASKKAVEELKTDTVKEEGNLIFFYVLKLGMLSQNNISWLLAL